MSKALFERLENLKKLMEEEIGLTRFNVQERLKGHSGSEVLLVDFAASALPCNGDVIIKLDDHSARPSNVDPKAISDEAHRNSTRFAAAHLSRVVASLRFGAITVVLLALVGGSFAQFQPLSKVTDATPRRRLVRRICCGILDDWNCDYQLSPTLVPPTDLLAGWLGNRLGRDSRLPERFAAWGVPREPLFSWGGRLLPNPLRFATDPALWPARQLAACVGRGHSDLHDNNVLVPRNPDSMYFYLVDLESYQPRQCLFQDTAYLEFSLLVRDRSDAAPARWLRFLDAIAERPYRQPSSTDDEGLVHLARVVRGAEERWGRKRQPDRRDHVHGQRLLARVAVGLNFANKALAPPEVQTAGLTFAAHSLDLYLDHFR